MSLPLWIALAIYIGIMAYAFHGLRRCHKRKQRLDVARALLDRANKHRALARFATTEEDFQRHSDEYWTLSEQIESIHNEKW